MESLTFLFLWLIGVVRYQYNKLSSSSYCHRRPRCGRRHHRRSSRRRGTVITGTAAAPLPAGAAPTCVNTSLLVLTMTTLILVGLFCTLDVLSPCSSYRHWCFRQRSVAIPVWKSRLFPVLPPFKMTRSAPFRKAEGLRSPGYRVPGFRVLEELLQMH